MSITIHPSPLPEERRNDPRRRAEMSVLDHLANSHLQGTAIYEWKAAADTQEVDIQLWVEHLGRFAIQVKGGQYVIQNHDWHLVAPDGSLEERPSPVVQTWDGALSVHDVLESVLGFYIYTIPVLIFPDMDRNPQAEALASMKGVHLVCRGEDPSVLLEQIAATQVVRHPPTGAHIENEVHAMLYREPLSPYPSARRGSPEPGAPGVPTQMELGAATVVIHNYGPLILHFGAAEDLPAIIASLSPTSPAKPYPGSSTETMPAREPSAPFDETGAPPQLPHPPTAERD